MSRKVETPEWWPEYKCPKCGYISPVTDMCRKCEVSMCATGYEEKTSLDEDKKLIFERRPMTKESELYRQAVSASWSFKRGIEIDEWDGPVPEWAWFGVDSPSENTKSVVSDGRRT